MAKWTDINESMNSLRNIASNNIVDEELTIEESLAISEAHYFSAESRYIARDITESMMAFNIRAEKNNYDEKSYIEEALNVGGWIKKFFDFIVRIFTNIKNFFVKKNNKTRIVKVETKATSVFKVLNEAVSGLEEAYEKEQKGKEKTEEKKTAPIAAAVGSSPTVLLKPASGKKEDIKITTKLSKPFIKEAEKMLKAFIIGQNGAGVKLKNGKSFSEVVDMFLLSMKGGKPTSGASKAEFLDNKNGNDPEVYAVVQKLLSDAKAGGANIETGLFLMINDNSDVTYIVKNKSDIKKDIKGVSEDTITYLKGLGDFNLSFKDFNEVLTSIQTLLGALKAEDEKIDMSALDAVIGQASKASEILDKYNDSKPYNIEKVSLVSNNISELSAALMKVVTDSKIGFNNILNMIESFLDVEVKKTA